MKLLVKYRKEIAFFACIFALQMILPIYAKLYQTKEPPDSLNIILLVTGALAFLFWFFTPPKLRIPYMALWIRNHFVRDMGMGILLACIYYGIALLLPFLFGVIVIETNPNGMQHILPQLSSIRTGIIIATVSLGVFFINSLCGEELAFRGFLFGTLEKKTSLRNAVIWNAIMFSAWHIPYFVVFKNVDILSLILHLIWLGVGCIPVCLLFVTTRNLYTISLYHAIVNLKGQVLLEYGNLPAHEFSYRTFFCYDVTKPYCMVAFQILALLGQILFAAFIYSKMRATRIVPT